MLKYLRFLKLGLSGILIFVGVKMLLPEDRKIPIGIALAVVGGILLVSVLASVVLPKREEDAR
jgi:tellurite resistance protein TerC